MPGVNASKDYLCTSIITIILCYATHTSNSMLSLANFIILHIIYS